MDREGKQDAVVNALFRKYFEEEANIGSIDVLVDAAKEGGLDQDQVRKYLESDENKKETVEKVDQIINQFQVSGVPFFVFNDSVSFSGAQEPETFLFVFKKITNK